MMFSKSASGCLICVKVQVGNFCKKVNSLHALSVKLKEKRSTLPAVCADRYARGFEKQNGNCESLHIPPKTSHPGKLTQHFKFSLSSYFRQEETRPASRSKSSSSPDANICEHQSMSDAWRGFFVKNHSNSNDQLLPHLRRKTASSSEIE